VEGVYIYRTRAAAGIGRACGPGASPATPDLRESARAVPRALKYRRAARLGCNGARCPTRSSTAVTTGFVRQRTPPGSSHDQQPTAPSAIEIPTTDAHVCANGPIFHLCPGPVQPHQSSNYELDRPGCDNRPLRRDMPFATGVDKADAPSHHYNRSKPRKLLAIQQGGIIGIASRLVYICSKAQENLRAPPPREGGGGGGG
jgi:hypothetical protein